MARKTPVPVVRLRTPYRERPDNVTHVRASDILAVSRSGDHLYVESTGSSYWEAVATDEEYHAVLSTWYDTMAPREERP